MKKPLATLALVAAAVAALAVPAGAAVPKKPASFTVKCDDGSGQVASFWNAGHKLAGENPCADWIWLPLPGSEYASGSPNDAFELAPGAHFSWSRSETHRYLVQYNGPDLPVWGRDNVEIQGGGTPCSGGGSPTDVQLIRSYKDVQEAPGC